MSKSKEGGLAGASPQESLAPPRLGRSHSYPRPPPAACPFPAVRLQAACNGRRVPPRCCARVGQPYRRPGAATTVVTNRGPRTAAVYPLSGPEADTEAEVRPPAGTPGTPSRPSRLLVAPGLALRPGHSHLGLRLHQRLRFFSLS